MACFYATKKVHEKVGSNPRPPACKAGAITPKPRPQVEWRRREVLDLVIHPPELIYIALRNDAVLTPN
jgi:hypothetical protein